MNYKDYLDILRVILGIAIVIFIFQNNVADAALDCSKCHTTDPGQLSVVAKDTIEISNKTCMKCHNQEYPPTPIGYNTHLAHIGKYSVKVDYLTRHPKVADSLSCNSCHVNVGNNCRNCHIKNIPHIKGDIGKNCKGCHGDVDKLFRHPSIDVKIHDIFSLGSNNKTTCTMCHNPDNMKTLKLVSGFVTSTQESHKLCYQCHSGYYKLWDSGSHYSNKTIPRDDSFKIKALKDAWEANWRIKNTCTNCHNPHNPNELYQLPRLQEAKDVTGISNISDAISESKLIYIIGVIIAMIFIVAILKNRDKLKGLITRISNISISKIISKISMLVSVSVEKDSRTEKIGVEKKVKTEEVKDIAIEEIRDIKVEEIKKEEELIKKEEKLMKMEEKPSKIIDKISGRFKKGFLYKHKGNILSILSIGIIFLMFYIIFGTFMPMAVIISESMSPHIEKGDIVFFTDIGRVDKIGTYDDYGYKSFGNFGDVILYKANGGGIPIVHRAIYYVEEGRPMWKDGPSAPYDGYITKGDNVVTNPKFDQQISTSFQKPVKREWIIGVAKFRIPYVGYIRLILQ